MRMTMMRRVMKVAATASGGFAPRIDVLTEGRNRPSTGTRLAYGAVLPDHLLLKRDNHLHAPAFHISDGAIR